MSDALLNALTVLLILAIGYGFKTAGIMSMELAKRLSIIVIYVTLPCAMLSGTSTDAEFDNSMLLILPLALCVELGFMLTGFLCTRDPETRAFNMINMGGLNIGNFVLPFTQSILSPQAFLALCLFDMVNALFCFGGAYCLALWVNRKGFKAVPISGKKILKDIAGSVTFYCCFVAVILSILQLQLPEVLLHPLKSIGSANTFLCMLVIGATLTFKMSLKDLKKIIRIMLLRTVVSLGLAAAFWFGLPYGTDVKFLLMVIVLAPTTSFASIMCITKLPKFAGPSADINMLSMISALVLITSLHALMVLLL